MTEEKSMVDALIQNPFGEDVVKNTTLQDVASDFPQEQVDAKRALVDTLPEKQQEQARALAKQIDEKNMQAIISTGQERKSNLVNSLIRCWLMCKIKIQEKSAIRSMS